MTTNDNDTLLAYLRAQQAAISAIVKTDRQSIVLDLSTGSKLRGQAVRGLSLHEFSQLINEEMRAAGTEFAFGRYAEPRELYNNDLFASEETDEKRTIHMGIDIFCVAGTPVFAPLDSTVELLQNNARELDYGPVIVLRHETESGQAFFTLYGHLSLASLQGIKPGQKVCAGEQIASVGSPPHNGNWPPHLHLQLISDLTGLGGDFPGVAYPSRQKFWLGLSPSPAILFPNFDAKTLEYV